MNMNRTLVRSALRAVGACVLAAAGFSGCLRAGVFPNGVDLQPSYYNGGNVNFGWSLMDQYSAIRTVRIEIEPTVPISQVQSWISQAAANGKTIICTYHKSSVLGTDDITELTNAANWWVANYASLKSAGSFTINLMNEWGSHSITSNAFASAYNNAISIVRQVYGGPIIIDCPGWGQETHTAAQAVTGANGTRINDTNIILSVHVYPNAWNQALGHTLDTADLDELNSAGRPCIMGEFGNSPSGSADWSGLVDHAEALGWTVIGWAWNGDGGSMNMVSPSWSSNPTATSFTTSGYFSTVYNKLSAGGSGGGGTVTVLDDFENTTDGWAGSNITGGPWSVTEWAAHGSYSLKSDVSLASGGQYYLYKDGSFNLSGKSTLSITVKTATWGSWAGAQAKLYVKTGSGWQWFDGGSVAINSSGTTLTLNLSGVANLGDVREIGVQFLSGSGASGTSSIYADYLTVQ